MVSVPSYSARPKFSSARSSDPVGATVRSIAASLTAVMDTHEKAQDGMFDTIIDYLSETFGLTTAPSRDAH